jgi:hypothetical protein
MILDDGIARNFREKARISREKIQMTADNSSNEKT